MSEVAEGLRVVEVKKNSESRKRANQEYEKYEVVVGEDGSFTVFKLGTGTKYTGRIVKNINGLLFSCSCEAWKYGNKEEPCKHGYIVLKHMFENGMEIPHVTTGTKATNSGTGTGEGVGAYTSEEVARQVQKAVQKFKDAEAELLLKADEKDEELAIKEYIAGSDPLVYRISWTDRQGREHQKLILSIRGWIQAMLYQGNIEVVNVVFEEIGGKAVAKAYVKDTLRNIQQIGIAERYTHEEFKWTSLASKAIRNALKKVVSPAYEQKVIQEGLEAKLVADLRGFG